MNNLKLKIMLTICAILFAATANASAPKQGQTMAQVLAALGEPLERKPAVGNPPITRWFYQDLAVVFEHNLVLHSFERILLLEQQLASGQPIDLSSLATSPATASDEGAAHNSGTVAGSDPLLDADVDAAEAAPTDPAPTDPAPATDAPTEADAAALYQSSEPAPSLPISSDIFNDAATAP